jgi:hypothetical protein
MSIGLFTDREHPPTDAEILGAVGPKLALWQELLQFIRTNYRAQEDLKFMYGHPYGWALRFRARGKLLTALYPTAGGFTVQIILNTTAIEQAQHLALGPHVQQVIAQAHPYPEGRWLFIPVEAQSDASDIEQLLPLRAQTKPSSRSTVRT